jgi:hypothetical protein
VAFIGATGKTKAIAMLPVGTKWAGVRYATGQDVLSVELGDALGRETKDSTQHLGVVLASKLGDPSRRGWCAAEAPWGVWHPEEAAGSIGHLDNTLARVRPW